MLVLLMIKKDQSTGHCMQ